MVSHGARGPPMARTAFFRAQKAPPGISAGLYSEESGSLGRLQRPLLFDELVYLLDSLVQRAHFAIEDIEAYS